MPLAFGPDGAESLREIKAMRARESGLALSDLFGRAVAAAERNVGWLRYEAASHAWALRDELASAPLWAGALAEPLNAGARSICHERLGNLAERRGDGQTAVREYVLAHIEDNQNFEAWRALREVLGRLGEERVAASMDWSFNGVPPDLRKRCAPEAEWACLDRISAAPIHRIHMFRNARTVTYTAPLGRRPFNYCIDERLQTPGVAADLEVHELGGVQLVYRDGSLHVTSGGQIVSPFATGDLPARVLSEHPPRRLEGTCCLIADYVASHNYAHWLLDWLPRVHLFRSVAPAPIDYYYVNRIVGDYDRHHLNALGIAPEQVIQAVDTPCIEPDRLLFSVECLGLNHPAQLAAPWALEFLERSLLPEPAARPPNRRLFVSRKDSASRQIEHEDEIATLLGTRFGFEHVRLSDLEAKEQARAFRDAEAVVAAHGAGLANLVFSRPGSAVLELFSPLYGTPAFFQIAHARGLRYYCLNGDDDLEVPLERLLAYRSPYGARNLRIDPSALSEVVAQMLARA